MSCTLKRLTWETGRVTAAERHQWKENGELVCLETGKPLTACVLQYMAFVKTTTTKATVEVRRVLGRVLCRRALFSNWRSESLETTSGKSGRKAGQKNG